MNAYLVYSQDLYLKEIFLENQIAIHKPQKVLRYSLKKIKFEEIAEKIFNFSLFGHKSIYFLEDSQSLKEKDLQFLKKIDFRQLNDVYIFSLDTPTYWKELSKWEGISGLKIKELKFLSPRDINNYFEKLVSKKLPAQVLKFIVEIYSKEKNFKNIIDAVTKASLYQPHASEISIDVLKEFMDQSEPGEINVLYHRMKSKNLTLALSSLQTLLQNGFKEEAIFSILIYKLSRDTQINDDDLKFVLELERRQKSQKIDVFFLLLELLFYFCQRDVINLGLGVEG